MSELKKLEKRVEDLEALVNLSKIEANFETHVGLVENHTEEVSHLRARVALLATLHRNELGLFGVDVEKWLKRNNRNEGV